MSTDATDLGPVLRFMQALWALEHGLNQRSKAMLREHGVTGPQRLVLLVTAKTGPIAPGRLAQVLRVHPASVTRLARTLERRGLLRRRPHPTDGRQVLLELAPRGRKVARSRGGTVESAVRATMDQASRADLLATERLVRALAKRLSA
ncbi:MAG: MarR family transcriptional regulator [Deltaproteobacteria bacterium]|nr:MarR family transcriptional regulator [Deltaproteobacteria bacterium]